MGVKVIRNKYAIKTLTGKTITLETNVEPSDCVINIKKHIEEKEKFPIEKQLLLFNGIALSNYKTLADYYIHYDSVIYLLLRDEFKIYINIIGIKNILIDVKLSTKIKEIKEIIEEDIKIPIDEQILIFSNKILENDKLISHYNIENEDIINMDFFL